MGRFQGGHQGLAQYGNPQQQHVQQHHGHNVGTTSLAPSLLGNHQNFANPTSNFGLFQPSSGNNNTPSFGNGFGGVGGGGTGLGSHAAQMGFAHGAALQRQEAGNGVGSAQSDWKAMAKGRIRDVWRANLAQEMAAIRSLVEKYPYISMVRLATWDFDLQS